MVHAVEKAGVSNMVWFNYRRVPAIALAKQIINEGKLGNIFHYRAKYLQDWTMNPKLPQGGNTYWRLDAEIAGSGVTGDMLSHSIDLATWLNGEIVSVTAMTETFIKEREAQEAPGKLKPVTIDDACAFLARFKNGSLGTFEASRYARGRKNHNTFEINGEKASLCFDLKIGHQIQYYSHHDSATLRGWRSIQVIDSDHPYMKSFWVSGLPMGYEHTFINALADFLEGLSSGKKMCPDFKDALTVQNVCDAILSSADNGKWEDIP
jgi:predicted dehydrogenase